MYPIHGTRCHIHTHTHCSWANKLPTCSIQTTRTKLEILSKQSDQTLVSESANPKLDFCSLTTVPTQSDLWATVSYQQGRREKYIFKAIRCLNFRHPSNYHGYSWYEKICVLMRYSALLSECVPNLSHKNSESLTVLAMLHTI